MLDGARRPRFIACDEAWRITVLCDPEAHADDDSDAHAMVCPSHAVPADHPARGIDGLAPSTEIATDADGAWRLDPLRN